MSESTPNALDGDLLTTEEAADFLRYSSPAAFRRAWRRAGLPVFQRRGSDRWLVREADVEAFLRPQSQVPKR